MQSQNLSINKIKKILFYFKYNFTRKIRILFNIDQTTEINGKKIILPPVHSLPLYSFLYAKYDNFLPKVIAF